MWKRAGSGVPVLAALALSGAPACARSADVDDVGTPSLNVTIAPGVMTEDAGGVVRVRLQVDAVDVAAGEPLLGLSTMAPGMGAPQTVEGLDVTDDAGDVEVVREGVGETTWSPTRAVHGRLQVEYALPIVNTPPVAGGPPINLRVDGDGFSGQGSMLIMSPRVEGDYRVAVTWNLSEMGAGAEGVSSYGDGSFELPPGPVGRLDRSLFLAGTIERHPETGPGMFSAVWSGRPSFDPHPAMAWTSELHAWMSEFFGDEEEPPYRVFLRFNPMNAGGGAALTHSFLVTWGTGVTGENLKGILGHEMTHTWTAADIGTWYSEGNAVYYQGLLPWRAGLLSEERFLADINKTASRYYSNPKRDTPQDQVLEQFWLDTRVRVLPYDRGAMYFALLSDKIREASGGDRSVDDLIFEMNARNRRREPVTEATWVDLLRAELGDEGPTVHAAMLSGELMLPDSDAFGPCFRRMTRSVRQFELGFDVGSLVSPERVIRGLIPGSEAEAAGLRDGDTVTYGVSLDALQGDLDRTFTLQVTRDGETFSITYLPRGEAVDVYQWERIPGAPSDACLI